MKRAGSIALRNPSFVERMIVALHVSRRRQARRLVRRYRYLIAEGFQGRQAGEFANVNPEKESNPNANGDQTSVRTNQPKGRGA